MFFFVTFKIIILSSVPSYGSEFRHKKEHNGIHDQNRNDIYALNKGTYILVDVVDLAPQSRYALPQI